MATAAPADVVHHAVAPAVPGRALVGTDPMHSGSRPRAHARPRTQSASAAENTPEGN